MKKYLKGKASAESAAHVNKVRSGFTLAEVLITLGIIGVVAAMTIPTLMTNLKAQKLRSQFLRSYSLVQQAFKHMEADDVSLNPKDYPTRTFYKTYMNYFTGTSDCGFAGEKCRGAAGTAYTGMDGTNGNSADNKISILDDGQFLLKDGTLIIVENANYLWVHVDINGYKNPPNVFGYDLFTFEFRDGELRTMGDAETQYSDLNKYCNFTGTTKFNGIACAHYAKSDSEYFKRVVKNFKIKK